MLKVLLRVLKYIFENGPNIGFWAGVLYLVGAWYTDQRSLIKIVLMLVPLVAILISLRKVYREAKGQVLRGAAQATAVKKDVTKETDKLSVLIKNVPSEATLRAIYKYAEDYAKRWASDGKLVDVVYYIDVDSRAVSTVAQIFISSHTRGERLTTYIPRMSDSIEELDGYNIPSIESLSRIYTFPRWKRAITEVIEKSSSDISKSDKVSVQLSPSAESMSVSLSFSKGNRKWRSSSSVPRGKHHNGP